MAESTVRLLHPGVMTKTPGYRTALALFLLMLVPIFQPVDADLSASKDDFGILDAMVEANEQRTDSEEDLIASQQAESVLDAIRAKGREISGGDAILATDGVMGKMAVRDSQAPEPNHPRPYEMLTNSSTQPPDWPDDLLDTLFSLPPDFNDPLAIGANTYALYLNFSSRNDGPSSEHWAYGTFTGELLSITDFSPFMNRIDIDEDGSDDVEVGLTILGIGEFGEGFGLELNGPLLESIWIRPTFQWRVHALNPSAPLWDTMESMEVTMMKGFAYDLGIPGNTQGESYALVVDTRFSQPPNEFEVRVGLDEMELSVTGTVTLTVNQILNLALSATGIVDGLDESDLEILSVSAPYSIFIRNPDLNSDNRQTDCDDGTSHYVPSVHHKQESREHRCYFGAGVGYVHFSPADPQTNERNVLELGYMDVGIHPIEGSYRLPNELDVVLRNDGNQISGENSYDTVELFSNREADVWFHYFEDRSNYAVSENRVGNITDSSGWIRGMPAGTLASDEIDAIFTMIGSAPSDANFPGQFPQRLSLIIAIKNYSSDETPNVNDSSLPVNPTDERWNSLILIAGTSRVESIVFTSSFQRYGYQSDRSSMSLEFLDIPEVLVIYGTFELPSTTRSRVTFGTAPDLISEFFDNIILNLVEIILDIGTIINGLPDAIVGTAGNSGGEIIVQCYNQVKQSLPSGSTRTSIEIGTVSAALSSSDHPILLLEDHIVLAQNEEQLQVQGRYGLVDPLVPISMSVRISNISGVGYSYDQSDDIRSISLTGSDAGILTIGHLLHETGTLDGSLKQFAIISNRPASLEIIQSGTSIEYLSSSKINSITYSGEGDGQFNALRLIELGEQFSIDLGETLSFVSVEPVSAIEVQISNATTPLTMDGDHVRFWVNESLQEASLSARISNITEIHQYPPLQEGADGLLGNNRIEMKRSGSKPFGIIIDDQTLREDPFRGLSGIGSIDPLPANLSFSVPNTNDSDILKVPDFGQDSGILALSFFLGELINFGGSINDFALDLMVDLGDVSNDQENMTLGLNMVTDESFDLTLDMHKGNNIQNEPRWVHGLSGEFFEATQLSFNFSRMPTFTGSARANWDNIIADALISDAELDGALAAMKLAGLNQSEILVEYLRDGFITESEKVGIDLGLLEENGVTFNDRRSWWGKIWLPNLPAGQIQLDYDFRITDEVPEFEIGVLLENYVPARPMFTIEMNGLQRSDLSMIVQGLDTSQARDVSLNAVYNTSTDGIIPRFSIDMVYDLGESVELIDIRQVSHVEKIRTDIVMFGVPRSAEISASIGDVLIADLFVPIEYRLSSNSIDSLFLQQLRYVEDRWWPSTVFMRDLPSEMHLAAEPSNVFNINEITSFQGMFTLDYSSNSDRMDLFLESKGKSQNVQGDNLMIAENLPDRFLLDTTDDWGATISASGKGVERIYIKRTNAPAVPGVNMKSAEMIGENLKGVTIHMPTVFGVPVVILDDITSGRIVATADVDVEFAGVEIEGRGVLMDAQFTGIIPTSSSMGVNGVVTDLSLIGSLTGGTVKTTHVMAGEPVSSAIATLLATVIS